MNTTTGQETHLLAQADVLLLCADLLRMPGAQPPEAWADALGQLDELLAAAGLPLSPSSPNPEEPAGARGLAASLGKVLAAASTTSADDWSDEYHRLFDAAMCCPPNQTAFIRRDKGAVIADITGFYRAFGFAPRPGISEKPDHIVTQLEFMAALLAMMAADPDPDPDPNSERQEITRCAFAGFASAHLSDWISIFTGRLEMVAAIPLFAAIARAVNDAYAAVMRHHSLPEPISCESAPTEEPDTPYECGMADASPVDMHIRGEPLRL